MHVRLWRQQSSTELSMLHRTAIGAGCALPNTWLLQATDGLLGLEAGRIDTMPFSQRNQNAAQPTAATRVVAAPPLP